MAHLFRILLLSSIISSVILPQNFEWTWQNTIPQGNHLNDAVILPGGKYLCFGDGSTVLLSTDSGTSWSISYPDSLTGKRSIYEASMVNASIGYLCGLDGLLMKTTDGGNTWINLPSPTTNDLWYTHFLDADTGYVCGASASLYKTIDGGLTWNQITVGGTGLLYKIYFFNNQIGYIGTASATPGRLLRTTDYGQTWNNVAGFPSTGTVRGIYFLSIDTGFVVTSLYEILKTTDGGNTFENLDLGTAGSFYEIKFFDSNNGLAAGADGQMYYTTDKGVNWTLSSIGITPTSNVYSLALENNFGEDIGTALVAGEAGVIAKSTDMGVTWTPLSVSPTREELRKIQFVSDTHGFAVGGSTTASVIIKTTDGGNSWEKLPFDAAYELYSHSWIDQNTGYVARRGPDGIFKTTDGGQNFTQLNPGAGTSTNIWYDMKFANADTGYACNNGGFIVKTIDGGTTWTTLNDGHGTSAIYSLYVLNSQTVISAGASGKIYLSTDGGATFNNISLTVTTTLYKLYFHDLTNGFVVGTSGNIYKTTDGGTSWTDITTGFSNTLYGINFFNQNIGWVSGTTGLVAYTMDGGNTWTVSTKYPATGTTFDISFGTELMWLAGHKGNIVKGYGNPLIPVELTSFTGDVNENNISLIWTTSTEVNNSGFQIERRSGDGSFMNIGFVEGKGTTTEKSVYTFNDLNLAGGKYSYRLKQIDFNGSFEYSNILNLEVSSPLVFSLDQNYPNPFNPGTLIKYSIPKDGFVSLIVYNILGQKIVSLVNENLKAGHYEARFNAANLAAGLYLYKLETSGFSSVRKMLLIK